MAASSEWNYTGRDGYGPGEWAVIAPDAAGFNQSPVIIYPEQAEYDHKLREHPLHIHYDAESVRSLQNTGHTIQIDITGNTSRLTGGPLRKDHYLLKQFHFHWGDNSCHGSEHRIGEKTFAAELHLVHWNSTQFSSFEEAIKSPNGLCVLGVFIKAGDDNPTLGELCRLLPEVNSVGKSAIIRDGFPLESLLPGDIQSYWTYQGSLTTPPCYESVRFIIFKTPITASERQLNVFRTLTGHDVERHLVNNFRPIQPQNGRVIKSSFRKFFA